jgi:hypothetical protein
MKKIPCLFVRQFHGVNNFTITEEVTPGLEYILAGEGYPTLKYDGTCCCFIDGKLYARYDAKHGKNPPENAIPCCEPDLITGHWPHWVEVLDQPQFKHHRIALKELDGCVPTKNSSYELCGPSINGNPHNFSRLCFKRHGSEILQEQPWPRTFSSIRNQVKYCECEGLVFWKDGEPVCKIRRNDFGFDWPLK